MSEYVTDLTGTRLCEGCLAMVPAEVADTPECPRCKARA